MRQRSASDGRIRACSSERTRGTRIPPDGNRGSHGFGRKMMQRRREPVKLLFVPALAWLAVGTFALPASASPPEAKPAAVKVPRYETDVKPILEARCVRCHGGERKQAALDL